MKYPEKTLSGASSALVRSGSKGLPPRQIVPQVITANRGAEDPVLLEYARMLYRRKGTLLLVTAGVVGIAALVTFLQKPEFEASATLEVQGVNEFSRATLEGAATPSGTTEADLATHAEALRQDPMIEAVAEELNLEQRSEFGPPKGIERLMNWRRRETEPRRRAVKIAREHLEVTPVSGSRIVRVTFTSEDPQLAADFSNLLVQKYVNQDVEARQTGATQVREWLKPQVEEMNNRLQAAEARVRDYAQSHGLILTSRDESISDDSLRSFQSEFAKAQAERIAKEPLYQVAVKKSTDAYDNPTIHGFRTQLADLQRKYAELTTLYRPESFKVSSLKAQITEAEEALTKAIDSERKRIQTEYESAERRETLMGKVWEQESRRAALASANMVHYSRLKHELDATREVHDALQRQMNEAEVAATIRPSNIRILGGAWPPENPRTPNIPLNLALGLFGGAIAAVGLVTLLEQSGRRLAVPGDVEAHLSLRELGAIPAAAEGVRLLRRLGGGGANRVELSSWENPLSRLSESFRSTLASLMVESRDGKSKVLVVTSPLPAEGKTTVTCNLGIALAEIGRRVLVIDGDMRRPRLHRVFAQVNSWGLSVLLTDKTPVQDLPIDTLTRKTSVPNLSVLPSGPGARSIFRLLCSEQYAALMRRLRTEFDHILIDAPPSLEFADARALAHQADGVILVLRACHTDGRTALSAVHRFRDDGIPVLGAILNDWNPSSSRAYGYHGAPAGYAV